MYLNTIRIRTLLNREEIIYVVTAKRNRDKNSMKTKILKKKKYMKVHYAIYRNARYKYYE